MYNWKAYSFERLICIIERFIMSLKIKKKNHSSHPYHQEFWHSLPGTGNKDQIHISNYIARSHFCYEEILLWQAVTVRSLTRNLFLFPWCSTGGTFHLVVHIVPLRGYTQESDWEGCELAETLTNIPCEKK